MNICTESLVYLGQNFAVGGLVTYKYTSTGTQPIYDKKKLLACQYIYHLQIEKWILYDIFIML